MSPLGTPEPTVGRAARGVLRPSDEARRLSNRDMDVLPQDTAVIDRKKLPVLLPGDMLNVENVGNVPVEFHWGINRRWTVLPGQSKQVLFEAVANVLGDPRSDDEPQSFTDADGNNGIVMRRGDELSRLFARYGIPNEDREALRLAVIDAAMVSVTHPETGAGIEFPAQNPNMLSYPVTDSPNRGLITDSKREIDSLRAENDELARNQARMQGLLDQLLADRRDGIERGDGEAG
jgi:hypothetical protein